MEGTLTFDQFHLVQRIVNSEEVSTWGRGVLGEGNSVMVPKWKCNFIECFVHI